MLYPVVFRPLYSLRTECCNDIHPAVPASLSAEITCFLLGSKKVKNVPWWHHVCSSTYMARYRMQIDVIESVTLFTDPTRISIFSKLGHAVVIILTALIENRAQCSHCAALRGRLTEHNPEEAVVEQRQGKRRLLWAASRSPIHRTGLLPHHHCCPVLLHWLFSKNPVAI